MNALERIAKSGIVPVVAIENVDDAVLTARALLAGGIDVMEITYRTSAAAESIKRVIAECPEMLVGAGTVINKDQCDEAIDLGCQFIVTPGFSDDVVKTCLDRNIGITPGCVTPTEIMRALDYDIHVVKFFPAGIYGGLKAMKALSGPFGGRVRFIPTGGVNAENLGEYISSDCVYAVGGTWLCAKSVVKNHEFETVTELCLEAKSIINNSMLNKGGTL